MSSPSSSDSAPWSSIYSLPLFSAAAAASVHHHPHPNYPHSSINPLNLYSKFNFDSMVERFHEFQQQLIHHHRSPLITAPTTTTTTTGLPFHSFIDSEISTKNPIDKLCTPMIPSDSSVFVIKNGKEIIDDHDHHQLGKHQVFFNFFNENVTFNE